jgi:Flp pilus assembly protein TadB
MTRSDQAASDVRRSDVVSMPPPWMYRPSSQQRQGEEETERHEKKKRRRQNPGKEFRRLARVSYLAVALILGASGRGLSALAFLAVSALADAWWWRRQTKRSVA